MRLDLVSGVYLLTLRRLLVGLLGDALVVEHGGDGSA